MVQQQQQRQLEVKSCHNLKLMKPLHGAFRLKKWASPCRYCHHTQRNAAPVLHSCNHSLHVCVLVWLLVSTRLTTGEPTLAVVAVVVAVELEVAAFE